jgi:cytochrome b561
MKNDMPNSLPATREWRYATPAILLHWLLALLIAGMATLGWYMMSIEDSPGADTYFNLHKSVGLIVFTLVLIRWAWRLTHNPAVLPASVPTWEVRLSTIVQALLYTCMILLPITGFLGASYSKEGVTFFGTQLPAWVVPDHDTAEQFFSLHETLVWILVTLVALHAAGGLKHLLVNRDKVFQRMWF